MPARAPADSGILPTVRKLVKSTNTASGWYHDAAVEEEQSAKLARPVPVFTDRI